MLTSLCSITTLAMLTLATPPSTRVEPVTDTMHGQTIIDDYRWLEKLESESEEVRSWTTAQNAYTRSILDNIPGREKLAARLGELMSIGSYSTPTMRGNRYFYRHRSGEQSQGSLFVREGHDGQPRLLLDPNSLDDEGLYSLEWFSPSHDGALVAFGLAYADNEMDVLYIIDVDTGAWLADEIPGKVGIGGWAPDNRSFVYGKLENPDDPYSRSYRWHVVGRHHRQDPMLLRQDEPSRVPGVQLSRDGRWFITTYFEGWSKQDIYVTSVADWQRTGVFERTPIAVGHDARFTPEIIDGRTMYMSTTHDAPNGMLWAVDLDRPSRDHWRAIIPHRDDAVLKTVSQARGMIVAAYEQNATSRFERFTMDGDSLGELPLPGLGSAGSAGRNGRISDGIAARFDRTEAFFAYESFNEPTTVYRVDLATGERTLWARPEVKVDPDIVEVKQEWCTSADGARVPMFITHRKGLPLNGRQPTVVYGYGGFNVSLTPYFRGHMFPWLESGGVFVVANLRGGGELGEAWHRAGMRESKQNTYNDLYAVAEHVIDEGYTSPEHLAVWGGSNGGLLTGVAAVQRPDLWAAVISDVPLLDMLRYHQFLMAKFWTPEYGDPEVPQEFEWLRAYSPYHHIEMGRKYPAIYFVAGENDTRVHPLHARKMAAAMQAAASNDFDEDPIMLWVKREAGHGHGTPLPVRIQERTDTWSFFMWQTGLQYDE